MDTATLESEVLKLAPEERLRIADLLMASVEAGELSERLEKYGREADDRILAYDRGEIEATDGDLVMQKFRARFG